MSETSDLTVAEQLVYERLLGRYGAGSLGESRQLMAMARRIATTRDAAASRPPLFSVVRAEMGIKENLAAWVLWRWVTKGGGTGMLQRMLGNKWTTGFGAVIVVLNALCVAGVIPAPYCAVIQAATPILAGAGLVAAKDATTGSAPGAKS